MTFSYFAVCLQIPYIFHWHSADAWLLVRSFFIIYIPAISSLALKSFFFGNKRWRRLRLTLIGGLPGAVVAGLFVLACFGGGVSVRSDVFLAAIIVVALFLLAYLLRVTVWLRRQIGVFIHGEYSNEEDFPVRFASSIVFVPMLATAVAWWVFLCDSRAMTAVLDVAMSVLGLIILLVILHPQRNGNGMLSSNVIEECLSASDDDDAAEEPEADREERPVRHKTSVLPDYVKDRLEQQIRTLINERQLFLKPGLKRSELSEMIGSNRTYVSIVFKERFGSFYGYINKLRIEYAIHYAGTHPDADQYEIAVNSGFGSVKTYTRVKKAYSSGQLS